MVRSIVFNLVLAVEKRIEEELKQAGIGAIMHDGWSKFGTHYVGLFAQFVRKVKQRIVNKCTTTTEIPANILLAMRPISCIERETNQDR